MNKDKFWPIASLLVCAVLYFIWPTVHTIALRKALMILGAVAGIALWIKSEDRYVILKSHWLLFIYLLLAWVVFHAEFISKNGSEAWAELFGQWLPPYVALTAGIGLGLASRSFKPAIFRLYLITVLASSSILYLIMSTIVNIHSGHSVIGYWGLTDHKLSLSFYAEILAALSFAKLLDTYKFDTVSREKYVWLLLISLAIYVTIFSDSLNGKLLLGICVLLTCSLLIRQYWIKNLRSTIIAMVTLLIAVSFYAATHSSDIAARLQNFVMNTKVAANIDENTNWRNFRKNDWPANVQDDYVKASYYLRIAYATAGLKIIFEHPWGYGVTRHAFERQVQKKYPDVDVAIANSHNGYIDLVCSVGFPALILLVLAIISVYQQLNKSNSEWKYPAAWIIGIIMLHWAIDPISRDHYFETFLFIIGLFATLTIKNLPNTADARQD